LFLSRSDRLLYNPCVGAGKPRPLRPRDRVLDGAEIAALHRVLRREPPPFGPGILMLLFTLQRRGEVFDSDCVEFDLERAIWVIPGARTKNKRAHQVPLSEHAMVILRAQLAGRKSGKLFPSRTNPQNSVSGFSKAWARILAKTGTELKRIFAPFSLHDLRRTGATNLQRIGTPIEVTEAVLNHVSGKTGGLTGVYQRYDYFPEKRAALCKWGNEVERMGNRGAETDSSPK